MEPTLFYIGLYFLVSLLQLASSRVDSYNGWKNSPNVQYHIQTDEGEERYFKYQTKSGQYRKEKRLQDGTVVGTYGWVDPNGYLRLRDYIADHQGYRILKTKMIYVGGNSISGDSTPGTFPTKYSPAPSATFQLPLENQNHRFGGYLPPIQNAYVPTSENTYIPPYFRQPYNSYETTTPATTVHVPTPSHSTPLFSYPSYYSSSTPLVEISHRSAPKSSTAFYSSSTSSPSVAIFNDPTPTPIAAYSTTSRPTAVNYISTPSSTPSPIAAYSSTPSPIAAYSSTPSPIAAYSSTPSPITAYSSTPSSLDAYSSTPSPIAVYTSIPSQVAPYSSTPSPIAAYRSTPSPIEHTTAQPVPAIGIASSTTPPPPPPPVSGRFAFFDRNNNFITESEKNKLFFQYQGKDNDYYNDKRFADFNNDFQEYDGISTVQNGFRYYLPRHYHEEQTSVDGQERTGSFGYIDPFGIRRVIYYNTAPGRGFVHRKNNRYVGFHSTPYDPRPNF